MAVRYSEEELIKLTDRDRTGQINSQVVLSAIADASQMVDSFIQSQVAVPMPKPPRIIATITGDIARYYLHTHNATEVVIKRYDQAIAMLEDVRDGKLRLESETTVEETGAAGLIASNRTESERQFTMNTLSNY